MQVSGLNPQEGISREEADADFRQCGDLEITADGELFLAENGIPDLEAIKKWLDEYDVL